MLSFTFGTSMLAVLSGLRTIICMGVAFLVWYVFVVLLKTPETMLGVLFPVWLGGLLGGIVSVVFSARQGVVMAFTSGVLLALGFLWVRHGYLDLPLGDNTFVSLWPVWFPPAFYVGAYGYLNFLIYRAKNNV
jgi:hypothetical protein